MTTPNEFISIIQVPECKESENVGHFIAVIDASGSMRPFWPALAKLYNEYAPKVNAHTITFDGNTRICPTNLLTDNIGTHGGGMTNIPLAFSQLDKLISTIDASQPITVLFVSDGQDNSLSTLPKRLEALKGHQNRRINFICLGIQSNFPTFLSMTLRSLYHTAMSSIPALFLIEYFTEGGLRNKFETMKEFFYQKKKIAVSPAIKEFPWSLEPAESIYEGNWLVIESDTFCDNKITIGGTVFDVMKHPPTIELLLEVFRSYVQEMQILSLQKSEYLLEQAGEALRIMQKLIEYFRAHKGIDLLKAFKLVGQMEASEVSEEVSHLMKLDFSKRVEFNTLRHNQFRIQAYYENMELLAKGLGVQQLNEWEAAKRIGIGTITGNYHQRALNLIGLTVDQFKILRNEFIELYNATQFMEARSVQEESVVTLQNQKDVFTDPEFVQGLSQCSSQFDLVETFPVVGLSLNIKRPAGIDINPWLVEVRSIAKHNKQLDSFSLLKSDFKMSLSAGGGEIEVINAVLPLFSIQDSDLCPLLSHDLFALLMTYVVQRNVDTLDRSAYLALLGSTLVYSLKEPDSTYKMDLIKSAVETIHLVYNKKDSFNQYIDQLLTKPRETIFSLKTVEDLSKPITFIVFLNHFKAFSASDLEFLLKLVFIKFFALKVAGAGFSQFVRLDGAAMQGINDRVNKECREGFKHYLHLGDITSKYNSLFQKYTSQLVDNTEAGIVLKRSKLDDSAEWINLQTLSSLYQLLLKKEPTEPELLTFLYFSQNTPEENDALKEKLASVSSESISAHLKHLLLASNTIGFANEEDLPQIKSEFVSLFQKQHCVILPLSPKELLEHCQRKKVDPKELIYDQQINFVRNACMASECPLFLQPRKAFFAHLGVWKDKCPKAFHKVIKNNLDKSNEELLQIVLAGEGQYFPKHKTDLSQLWPSDEAQALTYIGLVKEAYQKIELDTVTNYIDKLTLRNLQ